MVTMNALNLYCAKKQILFVGEKTLPSSCHLFFSFFFLLFGSTVLGLPLSLCWLRLMSCSFEGKVCWVQIACDFFKSTIDPLGNQSELTAIMKIDMPNSIQEVSLVMDIRCFGNRPWWRGNSSGTFLGSLKGAISIVCIAHHCF